MHQRRIYSTVWSLTHPVLVLGCAFLPLFASAQYSIGWHKIAGGGGTSTNAQFFVRGTIGQADAGLAMTNGQFAVTGGFWALPEAVQTEGAPILTITVAAPGFATISWAPNTPGFVLQETWDLASANWTNSSSGSANPATLPMSGTAKFFRLRKP